MRILVEPWSEGLVRLLAVGSVRGFKVSASHYYWGLAVLAVLMVIALVQAYRMWEEIHDVEEPESPTELLETFEEAHAAGELDDDEFERVRRRLAGSTTDQDKASPPADPESGKPDAS